jgi:2-keto-4-pentenoate hydratase/2-oxohepta-3-ene-1,7-dioic acid hydratase in catechol pathway
VPDVKKFLAVIGVLAAGVVAASVLVSRPLFDEALDPKVVEEVTIAPVAEALTFARYRGADGGLHLLLVTAYRGGSVTGLDVQEQGAAHDPDPIALFRAVGYDTLAELATIGAEPVTVDAAALELPFNAHAHNIGVGANYRAHAQEAGVGETPFLFPKIAMPTRFTSDVAKLDARLLDYEAELGLVLLDHLAVGMATPTRLGLVLTNEMTDRWALVRNYKPGAAMGTTGFADGKSRDGFAPIGPLLVIPRDFESFYRQIELRLYVDGRLRQRDRAANMTWRPSEILVQVFERSAVPFYRADQAVPLVPGDFIPAGTIIFSGTPAGVIFKPLNLVNPWVYLQPGNEIVVSGDFLGTIRNRIR